MLDAILSLDPDLFSYYIFFIVWTATACFATVCLLTLAEQQTLLPQGCLYVDSVHFIGCSVETLVPQGCSMASYSHLLGKFYGHDL